MLFSPVFAKRHPRRFVFPSSRDLCVLSVSALDCSFSLVASNFQFSIEDPDSVGTFNFQPSLCTKSFSCNTYGSPHKCCKQKTYAQTKPFRCNTYKNTGGCARTLGPKLSPRDRFGTNSRPRRQRVAHS